MKLLVLSLAIVIKCLCLFFFLPLLANANGTVVHHQKHGTIILSTDQFSQKQHDDEAISLEWNFALESVFTLNLFLTRPCSINSQQSILVYEGMSPIQGYYHCKITTTENRGSLQVISEGELLDSLSYVETSEENIPWTVIIKRSANDTKERDNLITTPLGTIPSTIKPEIFHGGGSGYPGQPYDPKQRKKGERFVTELGIGIVATLVSVSQKNDENESGIISIRISSEQGDFYDIISFKEWLDLKKEGKAHLTGLMEFLQTTHQRYSDSVALIEQILEGQDQDIIFEKDDEYLSELINNLKPPRQIQIVVSNSPEIVYLGGKKKGKAKTTVPKDSSGSHQEFSSDSTQPSGPSGSQASHTDEDSLQPPPPPPSEESLAATQVDATELDIYNIVLLSGNHVSVITPQFITALYSADLLPWSQTLNLLDATAANGHFSSEKGLQIFNSVIAIVNSYHDVEKKLLFLRLLHTYLRINSRESFLKRLKENTPPKHHASIAGFFEFSPSLFNASSYNALKKLITLSLLIPGKAEQLLGRFSRQNDYYFQPIFQVILMLEEINLTEDLRVCWQYLKGLLETDGFTSIARISEDIRKRIINFEDELNPTGTPLRGIIGLECMLDNTLLSNAGDRDTNTPVLTRFHCLTPEFKVAHMLAHDIIEYNSFNYDLFEKRFDEKSFDEILLTLALLVHKLHKKGKINSHQYQISIDFLKMHYEVSRGTYPEKIITRSALALALGIKITVSPENSTIHYFNIISKHNGYQRYSLFKALIKELNSVYQFFNRSTAQQLSELLKALEKNVVEIGAGHGMLSEILETTGFSVLETTDLESKFFPLFKNRVTRASAINTIEKHGESVVYIVASPDAGMMEEILRSDQKIMILQIGSALQTLIKQSAKTCYQIPLRMDAFNPIYSTQETSLLLINFDESQQKSTEEKVPLEFRVTAKNDRKKK